MLVLGEDCCLLVMLLKLFLRSEGKESSPLSMGLLGVYFSLVLRDPCCLLDLLVELLWR